MSEEYGSEAVKLLKQGYEEGDFQNTLSIKYLLEDTDLTPIREREDFRAFMKELEIDEFEGQHKSQPESDLRAALPLATSTTP